MMLAAVFLFSTMDVALKMLVESYGSMQVTFFRCATALPVFLAWILATDRSQFITAYPLGHLFRSVLGLGMLFSVGECFREMHLTDAYALFFAAPLIVTLLSGPVLGEPAGIFRITASLVGFSGVLIVLSPHDDVVIVADENFFQLHATIGKVSVDREKVLPFVRMHKRIRNRRIEIIIRSRCLGPSDRQRADITRRRSVDDAIISLGQDSQLHDL